MANGVCLDCRDDTDCQTGNAWNGDIKGNTLCDPTGTKQCYAACARNQDCSAPTPNCMKTGRCGACSTTTDCPNNDGPPGQPSSAINTVCDPSGLCINPFMCDPTSSPQDNNGCKQSGTGNNCMKGNTCLTCTKNADCVNDGGFVPNQPKCDIPSGVCVECGSNNDCDGTGSTLNCNDDGLCTTCTSFSNGVTCGNHDGPPGTTHINPNCDPVSNLCVDFCTADDQCLDSCAPHCNLDRGCCVQCNVETDCPVKQWRQTQLVYTHCSDDFMCTKQPEVYNCVHDDDCTTAGKRACSPTQNLCVECIFDAHCSGGTPACDVGAQKCVDCVNDAHCHDVTDSAGNPTICSLAQTCTSGSGVVAVSVLVALIMAFVRLF